MPSNTSAPVQPDNNNYVDYSNLYIKNLDSSIGNTELFELFRKFGRIVSARVMSNPSTGLSKGYGFVSFSKHEEAALALQEMNNLIVLSKPMTVAYHEPKKPRQEKSSSTNNSNEYHPHEKTIEPERQRKLSFADMPPPYHRPSLVHRPSLASLASGPGHFISSSLERVPEEVLRKGSLDSVLTETSLQTQRVKMAEAIRRCGVSNQNQKIIIDMLLTLKKKERQLCLFNSDFLKLKITEAMDAIQVFINDSDDDSDDDPIVFRKSSFTMERKKSILLQPSVSKAITIVSPEDKFIESMLKSFQGKPLYEKKQILGDQLFPLVKATGIKHAPKITIRLLDTIELEDLARLMFNKDQLKIQVHKIA